MDLDSLDGRYPDEAGLEAVPDDIQEADLLANLPHRTRSYSNFRKMMDQLRIPAWMLNHFWYQEIYCVAQFFMTLGNEDGLNHFMKWVATHEIQERRGGELTSVPIQERDAETGGSW